MAVIALTGASRAAAYQRDLLVKEYFHPVMGVTSREL